MLHKCDFILGNAVTEFESEFAAFVGARQAIGVGSGLDALRLALETAGVRPGDEVILPANTFIATALAVSAIGAKPVLVDVDEATMNINPALIEPALTPRTRAILPVHLYGQPAEIVAIGEIAARHKLTVIEDACQSHGAKFNGQITGTFGVAGCFSFYPAKNLGACGDGGIITTNDDAFAAQARLLRNSGQSRKYVHVVQGMNTRLDTLQAAILRIKLRHLATWNDLRQQHANRYSQQLAEISGLRLPALAPNRTHVFHLYVIRTPRRDALQQYLADRGIQSGIHYPTPIHLQPAYTSLGWGPGSFPVTEHIANEILSLPMFAELTDTQIDYVSSGVRDFFKHN